MQYRKRVATGKDEAWDTGRAQSRLRFVRAAGEVLLLGVIVLAPWPFGCTDPLHEFYLSLAVFGLATLWMAILADVGVSLIVTANALRLLRRA